MSYDIWLYKDKNCQELCKLSKSFTEWGTFKIGWTDKCELNITYNYSWFYYKAIDEEDWIKVLYGKCAKDTIEILEKAIKWFGKDDKPYMKSVLKWHDKKRMPIIELVPDYRAPTPWNACHALKILLTFAKENPDWFWHWD